MHCKRNVHDIKGEWHNLKCQVGKDIVQTKGNVQLNADIFDSFTEEYHVPGLPLENVKGEMKEVQYKKHMACIKANEILCRAQYRDPLIYNPILEGLCEEVEHMRVPRSFPFDWNTSIYIDPPKAKGAKSNPTMTEQERQDLETILHRNAVDTLYRIENELPLEMEELAELQKVIVHADEDHIAKYPFWVAEVTRIELNEESPNFGKIQVCWYEPKVAKQSKRWHVTNDEYLNSKFVATISGKTSTSDKRSAPKLMKESTDWIDKDSIILIFHHLNSGGKLPKPVVEALKVDKRLASFFPTNKTKIGTDET
jgi:hypothetical protein